MTTDRVSDGRPTGLFTSVSRALNLLPRRDRRILAFLILVQVLLALLDLIGVALIGVVVLVSSSTLTGTAPTGLAAQIVERLPVGNDPYVTAALLATCAGFLLVAKSLLSYLVTRRTFRFLANRQAMIASDLASALLTQPLLVVQERSSQETAATLTRSVSQLTMGVLGGAVIVVSESALLLLLIVALAFVDLTVTIFAAIFFAGVAFAVQRVLASWATSIGERSYRAEVASLTAVQEAIRSYREIAVAGRRGAYVKRFRSLRWEVAAAEADLRLVNIVTKYIYEIALVLGGGLLAVSQFVTKDATAAVTILAIFLVATTRLLPSVMRLQTAAFTIRASASESQDALAMHASLKDWSRLHEEELQELGDRAHAGMASGYPGFDATVTITDCTLWYPGASAAALDCVELAIPAGGSVALVGTTGAGKSTLADVVLGVQTPATGVVLVGGVSPATAIRTWPGALAYVPQEVTIIDGSVRSNIAIGLNPDHVDDSLVWESLERAHLADFLRDAREGLDTVVGEAGVRLSGGQRQRLGIARALYTRPRLVVLDEATSALDADTERLITDTLESMEGNVTTLVIAHRLATIRNCDQVVYLESGRVVAFGTFDYVTSQVPDFQRQAHLLGLR